MSKIHVHLLKIARKQTEIGQSRVIGDANDSSKEWDEINNQMMRDLSPYSNLLIWLVAHDINAINNPEKLRPLAWHGLMR